MKTRKAKWRDLASVGSSHARGLLAARVAGMQSLIASIDTSALDAQAKAAVDTALRNAGVEALAEPASGDLLSFGAALHATSTTPIAAQANMLDEGLPVVTNVWGIDQREGIDVPLLVTRFSMHLSTGLVLQAGEQQPGWMTDVLALRDQIVMGRWSFEAGETGRTELARGSVADYLDTERLSYANDVSAWDGMMMVTASYEAGSAVHQNLTDRPWQAGMVVPANKPLRFLISGADNLAAITPSNAAEARVQISFQGIRLGA